MKSGGYFTVCGCSPEHDSKELCTSALDNEVIAHVSLSLRVVAITQEIRW